MYKIYYYDSHGHYQVTYADTRDEAYVKANIFSKHGFVEFIENVLNGED